MDVIRKYWPIIVFAVGVIFAGGKLFQDVQYLKDELASRPLMDTSKFVLREELDMRSLVRHEDSVTLRLPERNVGLVLNPNASGREKQAYLDAPSTLIIRKE